MKLSLTIPTYNEEKNIHIPLDSAYDLVDEVVIVDGGSSDDTVKKAESYGPKVKVHHVDNPPNFLTNKQRAIEYAHGEWIVQLDADEAISPELKDEIRSAISDQSSVIGKKINKKPTTDLPRRQAGNRQPIAGFWIPRKNFFLGRFLMKGGVYPDRVLRLYKRDKAHFKLKDIHENAVVDGETGETKSAIEHYADPDFERYIMRWNRYTTFDANQAIEKKQKLSFFSYFIIKPISTFFKIYFRHKGFMDGFPGFVWALFSSLRYLVIYVKIWQKSQHESL